MTFQDMTFAVHNDGARNALAHPPRGVVIPTWRLTDKRHPSEPSHYVRSDLTDIRKTFARALAAGSAA